MVDLKKGKGFAAALLTSTVLLLSCGSTRVDRPVFTNGGRSGSDEAAGFTADFGGNGIGGTYMGNGGIAARGGSTANAGAGSGSLGHAGRAGGPSAAGAGGAVSNVPTDSRPPRPTWDPPFSIGEPGWKASSELLCEKHAGDQEAFDVWADARGVYGLFASTCNILAGTACGKQGVSLQFNDGTGWRLVYAEPPGPGMGSKGEMSLTGFDLGPLLISGFLADQFGVWRITPDGGASLDVPIEAARTFTVGADLAYAFDAEKLYRFRDDQWSEYLPLNFVAQSIWADKDRIVIVGIDQTVFQKSLSDADFTAIPGVPAGNYGAVWSFAPDDTWVGNQAGQLLHFDGSQWTVFETGSTDASGAGILELWGSEGQVFFRTYTEFGRFDGIRVELLLAASAEADPSRPRMTVGGFWGVSPTEVFVTVSDREFNKYACGGQFMLYFDGKKLHPF